MSKIYTIIVLAVVLCGCRPNQKVWDEIDRCAVIVKEPCVVIVVPDSKHRHLLTIAFEK